MYLSLFFLYALVTLTIWVTSFINWTNLRLNFFSKRIANANLLFKNNYIDSPVLFTAKFNAFPNITAIQRIDTSKAYTLVVEKFGKEITAVYKYNTFDQNQGKSFFNITIFMFTKGRIVELGYDYAQVLYTGENYTWTEDLLSELSKLRVMDRTKVMGFANAEVMN